MRRGDARQGPDRRPRRVLLVEINEDGTVGGSHQCLYDLAVRLDRERFVPVALFYQANRFAERLREAGVEVHTWDRERALEHRRRFTGGPLGIATSAGKAIPAVLRRLRFLRRQRIDLVHLNNSPTIGFEDWLPAARLARIPILSHMRGPYHPPARAASRRLAAGFDAVVAISDFVAESCVRGGLPRSQIRVIHDGIDLERWSPRGDEERLRVRAGAGVPEDAMLIVHVGLLRSWKGQDVALAALAALSPELRKKVRLWLVGEASPDAADYAEGLRRFVREHDLGDTVAFLGFRDDVPRLMGAADVLLHSSTAPEPFGLVVVEGLALGKPVIASRGGGPSEILRPGEGMLFDAGRPRELADLLDSLASSPELRERIGRRGHERARAFDVSRTVERVTALWDGILAGPGTARGA